MTKRRPTIDCNAMLRIHVELGFATPNEGPARPDPRNGADVPQASDDASPSKDDMATTHVFQVIEINTKSQAEIATALTKIILEEH